MEADSMTLPHTNSFCLRRGLIAALVLFGIAANAGELPKNVLLDFSATWCQPCQRISPAVHKLQQQGLPIQAVDVDQSPQLARRFNIAVVPTFVLLLDGKEAQRLNGAEISEAQLLKLARTAAQHELQQQAAAGEPDRKPLPVVKATKTQSAIERESASAIPVSHPSTRVRGQAPETGGELNPNSLPLSVSVRLIVSDATGSNFGSGTIIDSRDGKTLIVTCGHIFRPTDEKSQESSGAKQVDVDVFQPGGRPRTFTGELVDVDFEGDVAVVLIDSQITLPMTAVAALPQAPAVADRLLSVGCSGGENPTAEGVHVTALNRYDGPDNIECTGVPVQGRSGGGLFDARGNLVGVCIAADQEGQRGLYAGLKPIHDLLLRAGLKDVLPAPALARTADVGGDSQADSKFAGQTQPAVLNEAAALEPVETSAPKSAGLAPNAELVSGIASPTQDNVRQLFAEQPDAEVICIVRPKDGSPSRVLILNEPSTRFMSYLLDSFDGPRASVPKAASLRVEDAIEPLDDEWVPDDSVGVPKQAPDLKANRRPKSGFGSRSEN
jgi:thiol-disulfide isomerase/thioredoxin